MKQFFKSVDGTYIFYCCIKQWRHRWHSERHQEELCLRFVACKKQSYCKAKMLPGYTSLIQKFSNFPNTLTGTIFLLLYYPTEAPGKASVTPGKASRRMILTICNLLYDAKSILTCLSRKSQSVSFSLEFCNLNFRFQKNEKLCNSKKISF